MQPQPAKSTPAVDTVKSPAPIKVATAVAAVAPAVSANSAAPSRLANTDRWRWFKQHKLWLMVASGAVVVIAGGAFAYVKLYHKTAATPTPQPVKKVAVVTPPPAPILAPLTGVPTTAAVAAQPVFGVVIENSPEARPQSGLSQAGVVYETLAEGGITRFLAIFQDQQPTNLGPVRSLRPYFVDWAQEYNNAPVAHAGGSAEALALVPQVGFKSMNGLTYGAFFHRTGDRYAPHNLYTSTASLISLMQRYNWVTPPGFTLWKYKADSPMATPTHPSVTITFSYPLFTSKYVYNAACDCYDRFLAGAAHVDRNSNKQIQAKNVVVIVVQTAYDAKGHALDSTIGSGKAYVFTDGGATVGTWKKTARTSRIQFLDTAGAQIPLNTGNTWIGAIAQTGSVVY